MTKHLMRDNATENAMKTFHVNARRTHICMEMNPPHFYSYAHPQKLVRNHHFSSKHIYIGMTRNHAFKIVPFLYAK